MAKDFITGAPVELVTAQSAPAPLSADECKVVEACVAAMVSVFAESNKAGDDHNGTDCDRAIDALAAVACQVIRRASPLPADGGVA